MSTIEDFENAKPGDLAVKGSAGYVLTEDDDGSPWYNYKGGDIESFTWVSSEELAENGYTLAPPTPTNSREALDLAWELAYPVKKGQVVPRGTEFIQSMSDGAYFHDFVGTSNYTASSRDETHLRTLEPLPDPKPEPDWLDAPAVLAACRYSDVTREGVFTPSSVHTDRWVLAGSVGAMHWSDLENVTPLYPKEDA